MDEVAFSPDSPQKHDDRSSDSAYLPSSSGGVLVERTRGLRFSPLFLLLLLLLVVLFLVLYFAGYTGKKVQPGVISQAPSTAVPSPNKLDTSDADKVIVPAPEGEPSTVPGAPPGTVILVPDAPSQSAQFGLTEGEKAIQAELMMAFNLVNREIFMLGYTFDGGVEGEAFKEAEAARHAVYYARDVAAVGVFVEPHRLLVIAANNLSLAVDAVYAESDPATVHARLSEARASFAVAQTSMDSVVNGTY